MDVAVMFFAGFLLGVWVHRKHSNHPDYFKSKLERIFKR